MKKRQISNDGLYSEISRLQNIIKQQKSEICFLKNTILNSPVVSYWKNVQGVYLGENSACHVYRAQVNIIVPNILGMTDHDIYVKQTANQYRHNDLIVIESREPLVADETLILSDNRHISQLSMKVPIYDEAGKVLGVFGQTVRIGLDFMPDTEKFFSIFTGKSTVEQIKIFTNFSLLLSNNALQEQGVCHSFSKREKECAYYLLMGMTVKEISSILNISISTVECYLNSMKNKLGCWTKSQLINKLFSLGGSLLDR